MGAAMPTKPARAAASRGNDSTDRSTVRTAKPARRKTAAGQARLNGWWPNS